MKIEHMRAWGERQGFTVEQLAHNHAWFRDSAGRIHSVAFARGRVVEHRIGKAER